MNSAVSAKQDKLTFDTTPKSGSSNPITSGGVYTAINNKMDKKTIDTTVTSGSSNLITSGAVYAAINGGSKLEGAISFNYINSTSTKKSLSYSYVCDIESYSGYTVSESTQSGIIGVTWQKSPKTDFRYLTPESGTSTFYDVALIGFASNLRGSGTIKMELIGGHTPDTGSHSLYSKTQYPTVTLSVSNGTVTDITYNFVKNRLGQYYPNRMNIIVT